MVNYLFLAKSIFLHKISYLIGYPLELPISITISTTKRCYSKCKTCNLWKITKNTPNLEKKELSLNEWEQVLRSIGKGPIWFTLTGGEPMLREDLPELARLIVKYNSPNYLNIATSGIYTKKTISYIDKILQITSRKGIVVTINFSIDEINEKYETIRGIKGFKAVKKTYFELKKLKRIYPNLIIGINVVLSKYNYKRFELICDFLIKEFQPDSLVSELGTKRNALYFQEEIGFNKGKTLEKLNYLIKLKTQTSSSKLIEYFRKKYYRQVEYQLLNNKSNINCYAGYTSCEISFDGKIWDCAVMTETMGDIKKQNFNFKKAWRSNKAKKVREAIKLRKCYCNMANPNYTNQIMSFPIENGITLLLSYR